MAFVGKFIGIDRYRSPHVNWLCCARRDAVALEALFADTLGGDTALILDEEATHARIEAELNELTMVTYDADPRHLPQTAIPLEELAVWFSRIPARRLILLLDCCFSGGIGAKVLNVDALPRRMESVEARLAQMSGEGRLILTASSANEPAWENPRTGHGYLGVPLLQRDLQPGRQVDPEPAITQHGHHRGTAVVVQPPPLVVEAEAPGGA